MSKSHLFSLLPVILRSFIDCTRPGRNARPSLVRQDKYIRLKGCTKVKDGEGYDLRTQTAGSSHCLHKFLFHLFFSHSSPLPVTVVYGRFQNFPLEEFSENSALKGVLELTVHDCHTFIITAAHPAASGPAHTGLHGFSGDRNHAARAHCRTPSCSGSSHWSGHRKHGKGAHESEGW